MLGQVADGTSTYSQPQRCNLTAERASIITFLDALSRHKGDLFHAIEDADAEVIFNRLSDDPKVLAEYLKPRLVGGEG